MSPLAHPRPLARLAAEEAELESRSVQRHATGGWDALSYALYRLHDKYLPANETQHFDRRSPRRLQILLWIVFGYFAVVQSKRLEQIHHPLGDDQAARRGKTKVVL